MVVQPSLLAAEAPPAPRVAYQSERCTLYVGDCLDVLATLPDASVDAVVTDPPYELGFMGKSWDASGIAYNADLWRHCLRVLKPGGHLVAFGGTRTYHRLAVAIEDAGFEIRDSLHWIYGSGFPKSMDVSKAIDKAAGAEREVVGLRTYGDGETYRGGEAAGRSGGGLMGKVVAREPSMETAPATPDAARWDGWGTALKPAHEPIVLARKPLAGTVAANVLQHGTGALNIVGCRVPHLNGENPAAARRASKAPDREAGSWANDRRSAETYQLKRPGEDAGRWPANILLGHGPDCVDGGDCQPGCPVADMDWQSGATRSRTGGTTTKALGVMNDDAWQAKTLPRTGHDDQGGASRFFPVFRYQAKAPKSERPRLTDGTAHPTVKPLSLVRWLVRLVTPPGGVVLEPFAGSGTTLEAAAIEGYRAIGIEREQPYADLCVQRLSKPIADRIDTA